MSFNEFLREDQRLVILQVLEQDSDYSHNEQVIKRMLKALGHNMSSDQVRTQLHWLKEQDMVSLTETAGITVARLTERGQDVAKGSTIAPGIARPRPGE